MTSETVTPPDVLTFHSAIAQDSARIAIAEPGSGLSISYADLANNVDLLSRQLLATGIEPGHRVGLLADNGPELIVALLAVARAGAAAVPINPALTVPEIATMFDDLQPWTLLLVGDDSRLDLVPTCVAHDVQRLAMDSDGGEVSLKSPNRPCLGAPPAPDPEQVCLLLQTSGTTSRPKTVPLRQRNLVASARNIANGYGLSDDDVTYCVMPLFHIHGIVGSTLSTLVSGGTVVVPRRVLPSRFTGDLEAWRATWVSAVPAMLGRLTAAAAGNRPGAVRLRFGRTSSSALPIDLARQFEEALEAPLLEAYGMTEAAHQMASNPLPPGENRRGSVGLATGTELAIVDEHWHELVAGAAGEVVVRGPGVVDAYLSNPAANETSFRDGWFRTGDVGTLSSDRYLTLIGRIKEQINRGGEKIAPREIDELLLSHPAVTEAVAYGVADRKYGEVVHAVVVTDTGVSASELISHCAERVASFKVPVQIMILDEIPKSATGKVQRAALAQQLAR